MTQTDYNHELTTEVPDDFPTELVEEIRAADDAGRVLIDLEETNLRVAFRDDDAVGWLLDWLNDRRVDGAQGLADIIEDTFRWLTDGE
jgi:hypothetical protein